MDVMIPVWQQESATHHAKRGLDDLRGATVAIVDDGFDKPFTNRLEALLRDVHGALVTTFTKPVGSAPSPKALLDAAAASRVAIVGVGL